TLVESLTDNLYNAGSNSSQVSMPGPKASSISRVSDPDILVFAVIAFVLSERLVLKLCADIVTLPATSLAVVLFNFICTRALRLLMSGKMSISSMYTGTYDAKAIFPMIPFQFPWV